MLYQPGPRQKATEDKWMPSLPLHVNCLCIPFPFSIEPDMQGDKIVGLSIVEMDKHLAELWLRHGDSRIDGSE